MPDEDPLLDTTGVAKMVGLKPGTISIYLKRTRKRIADELPVRPEDFPLPDEIFSRIPAWRRSTIATWRIHRPGSGRRRAE